MRQPRSAPRRRALLPPLALLLTGSGALLLPAPAPQLGARRRLCGAAGAATAYRLGLVPSQRATVPQAQEGRQRAVPPRMQAAADAAGASGDAVQAAASARLASRLRTVSILLLIAQNTVITLLARETRIPAVGKPMYLGGAAVLASELIKLPVCLAVIASQHGGVGGMLHEVWRRVFVGWRDTLAMGIPALLFCFQNLLFFVSVSNLSATSYQLWSQSKTLTTALFFVVYLGGKLRSLQWLSLGLLCGGVGLVQLSDGAAASAASVAGRPLLGIAAVLTSSLLSGFANIYLEKKMKGSDASLWVRNVQLAVFGIPQAAFFLATTQRATLERAGLFAGFSTAVWAVVLLRALGGLIVAAVIKYADNIVKTYATAVAIVLTCIATAVIERALPTAGFVQGMMLVLASMFFYNKKPRPAQPGPAAPLPAPLAPGVPGDEKRRAEQ